MTLPEDLPFLNTLLNASALFFMGCGYVAIRAKKQILHRNLMWGAVASSAAFLTGYLFYHFAFEAKKYAGDFKALYYSLLLSHIVLAATVPFLVGFVIFKALKGELETHRRFARKTILIWAYVSLTGILVYYFVHV